MSAAKMGRPTDNPKETRITVRLDSESNKILNEYCDEKQISKADAIREAIKGLKNKTTTSCGKLSSRLIL